MKLETPIMLLSPDGGWYRSGSINSRWIFCSRFVEQYFVAMPDAVSLAGSTRPSKDALHVQLSYENDQVCWSTPGIRPRPRRGERIAQYRMVISLIEMFAKKFLDAGHRDVYVSVYPHAQTDR